MTSLSDNQRVQQVIVASLCLCILVIFAGCCSYKIKDQISRVDIRKLIVKDVSYNRTSLPDVFRHINAVINESPPQGDMIPQFVLSPSLGNSEISLNVDAITLDELLKILAEVAQIRFIHSDRLIIVAPVVAE